MRSGWPGNARRNCNVLGMLKEKGLTCPLGFNTDVNVAAIAELQFGQHGDISSCAYATVGTGIGVGVVTAQQCVSGLVHPEGGHIRVPRHPKDTYAGNCPFHGCVLVVPSFRMCVSSWTVVCGDASLVPRCTSSDGAHSCPC